MNYILVVAQPYLCVPAVLSMILESEGYSFSQETIAKELSVVYPDLSHDQEKRSTVHDPNNWGVHIPSGMLQNWFDRHKIILKEHYIPISMISEETFYTALNDLLKHLFHVMVGFEYAGLYNHGDPLEGHVSLVVDVGNQDTIMLLDPGPRHAGVKKVKSYDLYYAIKRKKAGIWFFSRI